jgi:hypothetical protein
MKQTPRYALAVSHPSHELRMHGLVEQFRPLTFVLTDGGGRSKQPRLPKTAEVLERAGAPLGSIFGRVSDLALYDAILAGDVGFFSTLIDDLTNDLIEHRIDVVVGDAAEGYSSAHDMWRLMVDAAVAEAGRRGREIANYEFYVIAPPDEKPPVATDVRCVTLSDGEFDRKMTAARAYSPKLAADVDAAMAGGKFYGIRRFSEPQVAGNADERLTADLSQRFLADDRFRTGFSTLMRGVDLDAFRDEIYWRRDADVPFYAVMPPFYEVYGEELVRLGRYERVIRYEEHMRPIAEAFGGV